MLSEIIDEVLVSVIVVVVVIVLAAIALLIVLIISQRRKNKRERYTPLNQLYGLRKVHKFLKPF